MFEYYVNKNGVMKNPDLCTLIVSDLHLTEAEPPNPRFPLWKKFKTKEFFFDETFFRFLKAAEAKAQGRPIELVLNGDIFDFDSVTQLPDSPIYRLHWLEKKRGLFPHPERSHFKIQRILHHHRVFVEALLDFLNRGHSLVFVLGNHDLEMHFSEVQKEIRSQIDPDSKNKDRIRFCEWFYISNSDTLVEHGNQYDPYCVCDDPINPFIQGYNQISMKLPFGNLACRFMTNGMGFFNPHVDTNYIMTMREYVAFFFKYMLRAQPLLIWTWFWGAVVTLIESFRDRLREPMRDPLRIENRINDIAEKARATPRMVRELKELFAVPAPASPILLLRELWLDRAFLVFLSFFVIFEVMLIIRYIYEVSFFWAFIPLFLLLPFFIFYSQSITSLVSSYKEPDERILYLASRITNVSRIVYGHTHTPRHEMIGAVEHLNSGTWSPAFKDVECTVMVDQKTCVWIEGPRESVKNQSHQLQDQAESKRSASLLSFSQGELKTLMRRASAHQDLSLRLGDFREA